MSSFNKIIKTCSVLAVVFVSNIAYSATVQIDVFSKENSIVGGAGLNTGINYSLGESISGSVDSNDIWGSQPNIVKGLYWSNADGLIADLFATGTDESGEAAGTQIGAPFPGNNLDLNGLSAPFGALVGEIDNNFFLLGTDFNLASPGNGALSLYYWDTVGSDNVDFVTVSLTTPDTSVSAVPVPAAVWLFGSGLLGLVGIRKKRS